MFSSVLLRKAVEWRPSAFPSTTDFWQSAVDMSLRSNNRKKDGKDHRYLSIVENHRISSGKTVQRTVLYLGEINDQQQAAWRKSLSVFDEQQQEYANLSLFPDDREIPADAIDSLQVKLSGLELRRPRLFGSCWLACELWRQLGLHEFWDARLIGAREDVPWEKVLQLLVVNRLLDPGSEFRVHRQWYLTTPWMRCLEPISPWPKRIACIAAWTASSNTSRNCFCGCARSGPICLRRNSKFCSMT
jgi:hypothetical protein